MRWVTEDTFQYVLINRVCRTRVLTHISPVIVNPIHQIRAKAQMAQDHNSKRGVNPLPALKTGTVVILQDGCMDPAKRWRVVEQYGQQVGVSDGRRIRLRNWRHVREYNGRLQDDHWVSDELPNQVPTDTLEASQRQSRSWVGAARTAGTIQIAATTGEESETASTLPRVNKYSSPVEKENDPLSETNVKGTLINITRSDRRPSPNFPSHSH